MSSIDSEGFQNESLHKRVSDWLMEKDDENIVLGHWNGEPIVMSVNPCGHIEPVYPIRSFYPKFTDESWLYLIGKADGCSYIMVGDSGRLYVDFNESDHSDEVPTHIGHFDSVYEGKPIIPLNWRLLRHFG